MAAQQPQPQTVGVPGVIQHFWTPNTPTYMEINDLNHAIDNHLPAAQYEDPVPNLWLDICLMYFPRVTNIPNGPIFVVHTEVKRGPVNDPRAHVPDVVTVQLRPTLPTSTKRDFLWVECKKAALDHPSGWKDVISQAVTRLSSAHPNRDVFLIIAIGTKCMLLAWNPLNYVIQPQLSIESSRAGPNGAPPPVWQIDQRVKCFQAARWIDPATGRLTPSQAYKLDCNTMMQVNLPGGGQQNVLAWQNQMALVENYLYGISQSNLQGTNPTHWS